MPKVLPITKTYLPEKTSLPEPRSTWRKDISVTPVPSILPVSTKGRIANGGTNTGYSQEHGPMKRLRFGRQIIQCLRFPTPSHHTKALQYDNSALQGKELEDTDLTWVGIFREAKGKSSDKNKVTRKIWSLCPLQLPIETLKIAQLLARWTYNLTLKPYLPSFLLLDASFLTKKIKK